jgi:hypothetical protein
MTAKDFVPAGAPLQESCGLRLSESVACVFGSSLQKARGAGIAPPSLKLVLVTCMAAAFSLS